MCVLNNGDVISSEHDHTDLRKQPPDHAPGSLLGSIRLGSASLTISSHLRPKAMRVSVSAGRSSREGGMRASSAVSANAGAGAEATTH